MTSLWISNPTTGHDSTQTNSRNHHEIRFRDGLRETVIEEEDGPVLSAAKFKKEDLIIVPISWIIHYQMISFDRIITTIIDRSYAERIA